MNNILRISDIMKKGLITANLNTPIHKIVQSMQHNKISSLVIVDENKHIGIITERDILKASLSPEENLEKTAFELMSSPVLSMDENTDYREAYMKMEEHKVRHLLVVDKKDKLLGMLSERDFVNHLSPEQLLAIKEVSKIMTKDVLTCQQNDSVYSVLQLMSECRVGSIVIEENNKAIGMLSERDALKLIYKRSNELEEPIKNYMNFPIITIHIKQTVLNAQNIMEDMGIRRLVVVDDNEMIAGILTRYDLIKNIPDYYVEVLREVIEKQKKLISETQVKLDEKTIFQSAMNSLPHNLVFMTNKEGTVEFINTKESKVCNIPKVVIGTSLKGLEGSFFEIIKNYTWKELVPNNGTLSKMVKLPKKDEGFCYFNTSISPILNTENELEGYMYIARDISSQQTLENELKRLNDNLQEAYHIAKIGNWELDANTLDAFWSDEIYNIFGMQKNTLGGPSVLKTVVKPQDFKTIKKSLISALNHGTAHNLIYEVFPKDGTESCWVECRARRELDINGEAKSLIGTVQDVTKRVRAEKRIEHLNSLLKAIRNINQHIVKEKNIEPLMKMVCDEIILVKKFAGVWILLDHPRKNFYGAGFDTTTFREFEKNIAKGIIPACCELKDELQTYKTLPISCSACPLFEAYGENDTVVVPIIHQNNFYGHIGLSMGNKLIEDQEEKELVQELANDVAFSIYTINERENHKVELENSYEMLYKLTENVPGMIYQYRLFSDGSSRFPYASKGIANIYEVSAEDVLFDARPVFKNIHSEDLELVVSSIKESVETMDEWNLEYRVNLPKKGLRWLHGRAIPEKLHDGSTLWHGVINDITRRKENERQLRQSATVFENTTEGVMITNSDSIIISVNDAFTDISGHERGEIIGKNPSSLKSGRHNQAFYKNMWKSIIKTGSWQGEIWNRRKNGEVYPLWLNITSVKNKLGEVENFISVFSDITILKETAEKLDFLAHHDHLTELPNRTLLKARLEHTMSSAKRNRTLTAVMFMDIDNFKNINDSYGHTFGDELLVAVANRLNIIMREEDTLARIGGDEFIIAKNHFNSPEEIVNFIHMIMNLFEESFIIGKKELWITLSIGISIAPNDGMNPESLIKNADTAMYEAKGDGKNTYKFYNQKMSTICFERIVFETALKSAIHNNEFEVYYQPQKDLVNNTVIGFEALVRWNHPTLGLVPPNRFIPIAEETKMIISIGEFVLEQACKDIKKWHDEGLCNGRIAVNVSGVQLEYSNFSEILKHSLSNAKIDPSMIEIEVTESMVMKSPERWIKILEEIKRIGVSISIDDFGTGYSSLSYLRRLPADTLKIDRSFIQDTPHENDACAIVNAIINMANSLGMDTLAEGVETVEQCEYLVKKGCKYAQGFLFSKAMNASDAHKWLKEQ